MKNLITKSFKILRNNLIFVQPLLWFLLIITVATPYFNSANIAFNYKMLIGISVFLLTIANTAGFIYINRLGVLSYDPNEAKEEITVKSLNNFKMYFTGVGEYFFKTLFGFILLGLFCCIIFLIVFQICGKCGLDTAILYKTSIILNSENASELIKNFSYEEMLKLTAWIFIFLIQFVFFSFFGYLYFAIIFSEKENILKSFVKTIAFFFKNFFTSIFIMLFMFFIDFVYHIATSNLSANSITYAISVIAMTLYLNYYIILVLCFYNDKTKNNSDNRTELIGQDISGN